MYCSPFRIRDGSGFMAGCRNIWAIEGLSCLLLQGDTMAIWKAYEPLSYKTVVIAMEK